MAREYLPQAERLLSGTIINASIDAVQDSVVLSNPPTKFPTYIELDPDDPASSEVVRAISASGSTVIIERGVYNGGVGKPHVINHSYKQKISAIQWQALLTALQSGYLTEDPANGLTRVDATHFHVNGGDYTSYYTKGRLLRFNFTDSLTGVVGSSSFNGVDNRTEIVVGVGSIPSTLTSVEIGIQPRGATSKYATASEIQSGSMFYGVDSSSNDAYVVNLNPALNAYVEGLHIIFKPNTDNTGPATINVNSLGVKNIKLTSGDDPTDGQIKAGAMVELIYNGTYFEFFAVTTPKEASFLNRQAAINGNFDIWQRGITKTNPATASFLADRWKILQNLGSPPTNVIHSRQALTPGDIANAFYFYRVAPDGAGTLGASEYYELMQRIENGVRNLCGASKKITVSFIARSSIANKKLGLFLNQSYGTGGSPSSDEVINGTNFTLTSNWAKYSYTFTTNTLVSKTFGTNNDDVLDVIFELAWGSGNATRNGASGAETFVGAGNIDIAQVQINAGDTAFDFQPKSFDEELRACQRFYSKSYDYGIYPGAANTNGSCMGLGMNIAGRPIMPIRYPVRMRTSPNVHTYSPTTGTIDKTRDASGGVDLLGTILYPGDTGAQVYDGGATPANGNHIYFQWVAEAEL